MDSVALDGSVIAFDRAGDTLAAAGIDSGSLILLNPRTGQPEGPPLRRRGPPLSAIAIAPDGETLVVGGFDGTVTFWSIPSRQQLGAAAATHRTV